MSRYKLTDRAQVNGAYISSFTSAALEHIFKVHGLDLDTEVYKLARNGGEKLQEMVKIDLLRIHTSSKEHNKSSPEHQNTVDGQLEPNTPVSPPVTSGESLEQWITAKEAALILGRGERTVRNYRAAGDITGRKKDGKTWEYDKASVEEVALQLKLKAA